jgi:hypothetical protein
MKDERDIGRAPAVNVPGTNRGRLPSLRWIWIGAELWAFVGAVIAWWAMGHVNADAKLWVGIASIIFPLCAVAAGLLIRQRRNLGVAGGLLFLSMIGTPTYAVYIVNMIPAILIVGLVVAVRKSRPQPSGPVPRPTPGIHP